ncbi:MAG: peptidoglycan-binding protein [bacterium]|nr:peptidoglycan-binding protein [bacterium]
MKNSVKLGALIGLMVLCFGSIKLPARAIDCYTTTVKQGSTGECVRLAQERLNAYRCNAGPADGIFGNMTHTATVNFQKANGLYADGIIGPSQTWPKLASGTSIYCSSPTVDDNAADRALCTNSTAKCILVHQVNGVNKLELYQNKLLVASVTVNTGTLGNRTRNTTTHYIYDETFPTEASEQVDNHAYGVTTKTWKPGVRQLYDANTSGLMGDPHKFNGGQAFHWRVQYSQYKDENNKSIPVLINGYAAESSYNGGYASHGCVHTPKWFLDQYDSTFFQYGTKVRIQDQPAS